MQLPVSEQPLQPVPAEQVQPIPQTYDTVGAQAQEQQGQAISQIGEMVQKRADQLNEQYRQSIINQRTLNYTEQESKLKTELLSRQGFNAMGIASEYAKAHKDLEEQAIADIQNPEDKKQLLYSIERNRIQSEDQLATSQIVNVRKAQTELVTANNTADKLALYQFPTNDNYKARLQSISDRLIASHKANGQPIEDAQVMIQEASKEMVSGVAQNFVNNNDYDSAKKFVLDNADSIGGKDSPPVKDMVTKLDNMIVDRNADTWAYGMVNSYYRDPSGFEKIANQIQSSNLNSDQKRTLRLRVESQWNFKKSAIEMHTESIFAPIYDKLANAEMVMFEHPSVDPKTLYNEIIPLINAMYTDPDIDPKKIVNLKTSLNSIVERGVTRNISKANIAETSAMREENKRIHDEDRADKLEIKNDQAGAEQDLLNNNVHSLYDLYNKHPKAGLNYLKSACSAFNVPNTWNNNAAVPAGDAMLKKQINKVLNQVGMPGTQERTDAFGMMSRNVATQIATFKEKNGYNPLPEQQGDFWYKALKDKVISKGPKGNVFSMKPVTVEFEGKQVIVDQYGIPRAVTPVPQSDESLLMRDDTDALGQPIQDKEGE